MTGALTGTLRLQSAGSSADVSLHFDSGERVTPEPVLTTTGECRVRLALTETPFARSLAGRAATAALFIGETLLVRQPVILTPEKGTLTAVLTLASGLFADFIGAVTLTLVITNEFGVSERGTTQPVVLEPGDDTESWRLKTMLDVVQQNAALLTTPAEGKTTRGGRGVAAYAALIERTAQLYARYHHYFEKSARFRLQEGLRMTSVARVESVTHRTLAFVATHPEELVPAPQATGICCEGTYYLPARTLDETQLKSYDIYENRCLVGFLKTTAAAAKTLFDELREEDRTGVTTELVRLMAVYGRLFGITDTGELTHLPEPSAIFSASLAYRPFYELMQAWFAFERPTQREVKFYVDVKKSSRLYEYYVLTELIRAFGGAPESRRIVAWPKAHETGEDAICNEYRFVREDSEVTLWYEPRIGAGTSSAKESVGLVRTMTLDFAETGAPFVDPAGAYWTPDFVVRIKTKNGVKFWVADAKYATWPTVSRFYAAEVMLKSLVQTAPADPRDQMAGLVLFCGKDRGAGPAVRSMRNIDAADSRATALTMVTLAGDASDAADRLLEKVFCIESEKEVL